MSKVEPNTEKLNDYIKDGDLVVLKHKGYAPHFNGSPSKIP